MKVFLKTVAYVENKARQVTHESAQDFVRTVLEVVQRVKLWLLLPIQLIDTLMYRHSVIIRQFIIISRKPSVRPQGKGNNSEGG